jgi:competence protein ComEC
VRVEDLAGAQGLTDAVIDPVACAGGDPHIRALWGQVTRDPGWGIGSHGQWHFHNANNHSVAVRVDLGEASVLLTGDMEEAALPDFVARYAKTQALDVDVYQAGHHGSDNGTDRGLMAAMTPEVAVISMGPPGRRDAWTAWQYGHPRRDAMRLMQEGVSRRRTPAQVQVARAAKRFEKWRMDAAVYATGWDGTVVIEARADGALRVLNDPDAP